MRLRLLLSVALLAAAAVSIQQTTTTSHAVPPIKFTTGTIGGSGFSTVNPTSIEVGPDGRLYVADGGAQGGRIQALTLNATTKAVTAVQTVTTSAQLQEVYGIAFDPDDASSPPPIYVTNTISGFGQEGQAADGTYPGKVTKIHGAGYSVRDDIITGLSVSNSGHESNGLAFGPDGRLYIAQGSTTNAGVPYPASGIFQWEEAPLSGAMLVADVNVGGFDGNILYSPPGVYSNNVVQTAGDVSVYAPGLRNPYDLVFHSNGKLYNTDNGPNDGYGYQSTSCSTDSGVHAQAPDELNIIQQGKFYGHPNRNRGFAGATEQCVYHPGTEASSGNYEAPIALLPPSSNGLVEYKSAVFSGQMQGDLLYVSWVTHELHRVKLAPDGNSVVFDALLASGLTNALDVAVGSDGTIYVAEWGSSEITFFKPDESGGSPSVTGIFPAIGPIDGGQDVTVSGGNFSDDTTVTIGGQPLQNAIVHNATTITGTTPPNTLGIKDVVVTHHTQTATLAGAYEYIAGGGQVPPFANAGPDIFTPVAHGIHAHVTLDGRASFDPDGATEDLTFEWTENGNVVSTLAADSLQLAEGIYVFDLTVTDIDGLTDTDQVRVTVTAEPLDPEPYFCFDVTGDTFVNVIDLFQVAQQFGTNFWEDNGAGYTRMKDWNADRYINILDLWGTAQDFTASGETCPLVDQQIREATVYMEQFQDVNDAIAAGYLQVTPYIPGMGRHMVQGTVGGQDTIFEPGHPESLLYEPDPSMPGGWRLGGAMYIIPISLQPLPPEGFATVDDAWHYHDNLCIWNNFQAVAEGVSEADCLSRPGNPIWIPQAGWLLHLWNYAPNGAGRFVEISPNF